MSIETRITGLHGPIGQGSGYDTLAIDGRLRVRIKVTLDRPRGQIEDIVRFALAQVPAIPNPNDPVTIAIKGSQNSRVASTCYPSASHVVVRIGEEGNFPIARWNPAHLQREEPLELRSWDEALVATLTMECCHLWQYRVRALLSRVQAHRTAASALEAYRSQFARGSQQDDRTIATNA